MATNSDIAPADSLADLIRRRVDGEGPTKGLVHAQYHNNLAAEALAEALATATVTTPTECDRLLESGLADDGRAAWCKAAAGMFYDDIQYKAEKARDDDGNEVVKQVPVPHKINVSVRFDKFGAEIRQAAGLRLKEKLRNKPVAWPDLRPDNAAFLRACKALLPNVENPAAAATALRILLENMMANRGVEGARRQQKFVMLLQRLNGGGGKGLFMDALEEGCRRIGLMTTEFDPSEYHFVSDAPAYSDLLTSHEAPRVPKEAHNVVNNVVDNAVFEAQRKHCDAQMLRSVGTLLMASNFEYSDPNNRRAETIEFAANRILTLADGDMQYFKAYHPARTNRTGVRYEVTGNADLAKVVDSLFASVVFGAVYETPPKAGASGPAVVQLDHRHLRALQIMQQVRDAAAQDGSYAIEYENSLTCRPATDYRDVDHCITHLVKASIIDKSEKAVVRSLLCQLILEASRLDLIPGHGRKADRIPFTAYDFASCTVDDPDGADEGYTFAAISKRWDRLIAAYTDGPTGGNDHDGQTTCRDEGQRQAAGDDNGGDHQADDRGPEGHTAHDAVAARKGVGPGVAGDSGIHCVGRTHGDPAQVAPLDVAPADGAESTLPPTCADSETTAPLPWADSSIAEGPTQARSAQAGGLTFDPTDPRTFPGNEVGQPREGGILGEDVVYWPDGMLTCYSRYTTGADCKPVEGYDGDRPEYLLNCRNKPGHTGRCLGDVIPTYMVFEADHVDGDEQLRNIDWSAAEGHIATITDSAKASKHILVPLGPSGRLIQDNDAMRIVCQEVARSLFKDPSVLDPATWTINRLTRAPGGKRTAKDDDDRGPWVGARQRQLYVNEHATPPPGIEEIVRRAVAQATENKLRKAFVAARHDDDDTPTLDVPALLERHGWTRLGQNGDNEQWQRPGKAGGSLSAHWDGKCFFCFTSSVDGLDAGKGYSALGLLAALEYDGDRDAARKALEEAAEKGVV